MNEGLVDLWNSQVGPKDNIWHLGDLAFVNYKDVTWYHNLFERLNGNKHLIVGNHDDKKLFDLLANDSSLNIKFVDYYHELKHEKKKIVLCHYPFEVWRNKQYGSWHLHGHCVDLETEILTLDGWKTRFDISTGDLLYSVNKETREIELDSVKRLFDKNYTGKVISLKSKSVDFRVTGEHKIVGYDRRDKFVEFSADDLINHKRHKFIRSASTSFNGLPFSDDMLRLYVYCTADGSLKKETNLWRIRVKKEHKVIEIRRVLESLGIPYKEYHSDAHVSYNFYTPKELMGINFKGLDPVLDTMTADQFSIFIDAYSKSDGNRNGNGVILYTSKESEVDLVSALAVVRGWGCTILKRDNHGFSKNSSWQLSLFPSNTQMYVTPPTTSEVVDEHFWCIETGNGNFFMRRNGKIHLTGNCHGSLTTGLDEKRLDVGLDNHPDHKFFTFEDIKEIMSTRNGYRQVDHHTYKT